MQDKIASMEARNLNDPSNAFKLRLAYAEYVNRFPDDVRYLMKAGDRFFQMKRYEEAIDYYSGYLNLRPGDVSVLSKRSAAYLKRRQFDQAVRDIEKALVSVPNDVHLTEALEKAKILSVIFRDIQKADDKIRSDAYNPSHYLERGKLFFLMKSYRAAAWDFSKVVQIKGVDAEALYLRGASYFAVLSFDKALEDLNRLIRMNAAFGSIQLEHFMTMRQIIEEVKAFNSAGKKFKMPEFSEEFLDY